MTPFLAGRPSIDGPALRPAAGTAEDSARASLPAGGSPSHGHAARSSGHAHATSGAGSPGPTVECIKQGDKVVRLIITCTCGERVEVECLYPAGG